MLRCYVPDLTARCHRAVARARQKRRRHRLAGSYGQGNDLLPLLGLPPNTFLVTDAERADAIERGKESRDETS